MVVVCIYLAFLQFSDFYKFPCQCFMVVFKDYKCSRIWKIKTYYILTYSLMVCFFSWVSDKWSFNLPSFVGILSFKCICSKCSNLVVPLHLGISWKEMSVSPRHLFLRKTFSLTINITTAFSTFSCTDVSGLQRKKCLIKKVLINQVIFCHRSNY